MINGNADQRLDQLVGASNRAVSGLSRLTSGVNTASIAFGSFAAQMADRALSALYDFSAGVIDATADMQGLNNAIKFASGSPAEADKNLTFLRQTVDGLGLDLKASAEGFKTFQGAAMGSSLAGQGARDVFESVSLAATTMGLSADNQSGVFLALGQMLSKGKVQAEELRGQLGERLPGAFQIAARSMGVTTAELDKMLQSGQVISEQFLPLFAKELRKTFADGATEASQSLRANLNRWNTAILDAKVRIGEAISAPLGNLLAGGREQIAGLSEFVASALQSEGFQQFIGAIGEAWNGVRQLTVALYNEFKPELVVVGGIVVTLAEGIGSLTSFLSENADVLKASLGVWAATKVALWAQTLGSWAAVKATIAQTAAQWGLNAALLANPIGLIVLGIAALAGAFYVAWQRSETFRGTMLGLWEVMKELGSRIMGAFELIWNASSGDREVISAAYDKMMGNGKSLGDAFNEGFNKAIKGNKVEANSPLANQLGVNMGYLNNPFAQGGGATKPPTTDSTIDKGLDKVSGGGSRPVNINISLGALVEGFTIETNNIQQGAEDMRDLITEQLLRVVNGANQLATG